MADGTHPRRLLAQAQREAGAQVQAELRARARGKKAVQHGWQSRTAHGRRLFVAAAGRVTAAIDRRLSWWWQNPERAGYHAAALPVLASLFDPRRVTAVVLPVMLDRITEPTTWEAMACRIGQALEAEVSMRRLKKQLGPSWLRQLVRTERARLRRMDRRLLKRLGASGYHWTQAERFTVGALVLDCVAEASGLFKVRHLPTGETQLLPSEYTQEVIASCPPDPVNPVYTPMVCPPRPWPGLIGGGLLETDEPLVRAPSSARATPYRTAMGHLFGLDLSPVLEAANALQAVTLRIDPDMAQTQAESWRANIRRGLWPVGSQPTAPPERPISDDPEALRSWRAQCGTVRQGVGKELGHRLRISRCLTTAQELAGRPIWQAAYMDHRGRVYAANQLASHQGPDHQKALLEFGTGEPMSEQDARWLLIAAANHHGCGRIRWEERAAYGAGLIEDMRAVAGAPLDHLELWRDAKDPWQFLQVALAWSAWEADKAAPVYCPIRFDQTTSGPGILAALLRDRTLATACNMTGNEPADLYLTVLGRVQRELQRLAFQGDERERGHAATLAPLVGRDQMKTAVMAAPYGASFLGLKDSLVDWLAKVKPGGRFLDEVLRPATFLAPIVWREAQAVTGSGCKFRRWFGRFCAGILTGGRPIEWTTPAGLVVSTGERPTKASRINTEISGRWCIATILDADVEAPLSANQTRKKLTANLIHSLDGAMVHRMASTAGALGAPLLTNHDCFATLPSRAEWLQGELLKQTRRMYEPDLLGQLIAEIAERGNVDVPKGFPTVGDLDPAAIGSNPYLYG